MSGGKVPAFRTIGKGPVVIFITGLGGLASYWERQIEALSGRYTCVSFDQPGIGDTVATPQPWSTRGWADDVLSLADEIGADRFALVGHSTGGAIAQHVAAAAAARISALVLSGTWAYADERFLHIFALRRKLLCELGPDAYHAIGAVLTRPLEWPAARVTSGASGQPAVTTDVILGRIDALVAHDGRNACAEIRSPALITAARDDLLVPHNHAYDLATRLSNAELVFADTGGHHFPQTQSAWFNRHLATFLGRYAWPSSD